MKRYPIEVEETRQINRITFKQSFLDLLNAFNIERGLIYTLKLLFLSPGKIVDQYLNEGRYKIVNAFRLLILSTAVSLFVMYFVGIDEFLSEFERGFNKGVADKEIGDPKYITGIMQILFDWYNLFLWMAIPIYGFFSFLFFEKRNFNYAEHMVVQSFYICALNIITIVVFPLYVFVGQDALINIVFFLSTAYFIFFTIKVFKVNSFGGVLKTLLIFILNNIAYAIALVFVVGMFVGYAVAER